MASRYQTCLDRITGGGTAAGGGPSGAVENPDTGLFESLPGCAALSNVTPQDPAGGCLWDVAQFRDLSPQEEYLNFFSRGTFAFNDNAELYTEFSYSKKKTEFNNTPSGVSGAWGYPGGPVNASSGPGAIVLGPDHPDNLPTGAARQAALYGIRRGPARPSITRAIWCASWSALREPQAPGITTWACCIRKPA